MKLFAASTLIITALLLTHSSHAEWKHRGELGAIVSSGNTESITINAKESTVFQFQKNAFKFSGRLFLGSLNESLNARQWSLGLRYDRDLFERFGAYLGEAIEGDSFAGYSYRLNSDIGGKATLFSDPSNSHNIIKSELGYRYQLLRSTDEALNLTAHSYLRGFIEGQIQFLGFHLFNAWIELLPELNSSQNIEINFETSFQVFFANQLSLKLGFLGMYSEIPKIKNLKKFDSIYTTSLVATF